MIDSDPGPLPTSPFAMGGPTVEPDEHEPYLELLQWIFTANDRVHKKQSFRRVLSAEQRVDWMRRNLPRTYALLTVGHRWAELSDF